MKLGQKSVKNLVGFLGDLKTPKFHSEINWPLIEIMIFIKIVYLAVPYLLSLNLKYVTVRLVSRVKNKRFLMCEAFIDFVLISGRTCADQN